MIRWSSHAAIFSALSALFILCSFFLSDYPLATLYIVTLAVLTLGIPHGILDLEIGRKIWPLSNLYQVFAFLGLYVLIAACAFTFWLVVPNLALFAFLLYSIFHFSGDWVETHKIKRVYLGGVLVICLPLDI